MTKKKDTEDVFGFTTEKRVSLFTLAYDIYLYTMSCDTEEGLQEIDVIEKIEAGTKTTREAIYVMMTLKDMALVFPGDCDRCKKIQDKSNNLSEMFVEDLLLNGKIVGNEDKRLEPMNNFIEPWW